MELGDRSKYLGSSDIAAILGISPWKTKHLLWREKTGRVIAEDISGKFHVQRGVEGEIVAREKICDLHSEKYEPSAWQDDFYEFMRAHDDGYSERLNEHLEIKCMGKDAHEAAKLGEIPDYYLCQIQYCLMLSGAKKTAFISFQPETGDLVSVDVLPDAKYQAKIRKAALEFWEKNVVGGEEPELADGDFDEIVEDAVFEALASDFIIAKERLKEIEDRYENLRTRIQEHLGERKRVRGYGLICNTITRKGAVDYKKIPELAGVDLEPYRKKPVMAFDIRLEK
jgi:putative phage-type endonuclease